MKRQVLIVGASARAAAQSAVRSGWNPLAIDQFADADLRATCPVRRAPDYPQGLASIAREFPPAPFLYTGALENHLDALQDLAVERPLLGNGVAVVRAVRDPYQLRAHLDRQGLLMPELRSLDESPLAGEWLLKPYRSGGGTGIEPFPSQSPGEVRSRRSSVTHYLQRQQEGLPISAQFLGSGGRATLLGITRQLIGCDWAGAKPFWYVGNIGPWIPSPAVTGQILQVGQTLADTFGLIGLFGVDAIQQADELWTLEVNPRYTAATEIVERITGLPLLQFHVDACQGRSNLPAVLAAPADREFHGKATLYAPQSYSISDTFPWPPQGLGDCPFPFIADLPAGSCTVPAGGPVCTIFTAGPSEATVVDLLRRRAFQLFHAFSSSQVTAGGLMAGEAEKQKLNSVVRSPE